MRANQMRGSQRGVATVELALCMLFLLTLAFGMTELGRALFHYDALAKSARAAARYLAVFDAGDAAVREQARNVAVCGMPSGCAGQAPVAPGLKTAHVDIGEPGSDPSLQDVMTGDGTLDLVRVTISPAGNRYRFDSLVSFVIPSFQFGPISVTMPQVYF